MSADFAGTGTASQRLTTSGGIPTAAPFTLAAWIRPTSSGVGGLDAGPWAVADTATDTNYWALLITGSWRLQTNAGAGSTGINVGTAAIGQWQYVMARMISSTNRRLSVLNADGTISHGQDTTARTPGSIDTIFLGMWGGLTISSPFAGQIAELFLLSGDILPNAQQMDDGLLRKIAYEGPFQHSRMEHKFIQYRSFQHTLINTEDEPDEIYRANYSTTEFIWLNVNQVQNHSHPPLIYNKRRNISVENHAKLRPIFAGMTVATASGASFSWGAVWRNRLMMVGHGR